MTFTIDKAARRHVAALAAVERAAARLFEGRVPREVLEDTTPEGDFLAAMAAGLLWVALVEGMPVGFAMAVALEESLHLEEMDVHPDYGRRGIGTALVEIVCAEAAARGTPAVTLTTYRSFPWNLPFYRKLGFAEAPVETLAGELGEIVRAETARGLDPAERVALRRLVDPQKR